MSLSSIVDVSRAMGVVTGPVSIVNTAGSGYLRYQAHKMAKEKHKVTLNDMAERKSREEEKLSMERRKHSVSMESQQNSMLYSKQKQQADLVDSNKKISDYNNLKQSRFNISGNSRYNLTDIMHENKIKNASSSSLSSLADNLARIDEESKKNPAAI